MVMSILALESFSPLRYAQRSLRSSVDTLANLSAIVSFMYSACFLSGSAANTRANLHTASTVR